MIDPSLPAFSVFAFLSFILVLIPLPWHFQAWNSGTCLYMIWTAIGCLNLFINSIIWHNNAIDSVPVWCDISTRIVLSVAIAIPAASLCINRRLYKIASCQTATISRGQRKRAVIVDLTIGLGIPLLQIPLQFIVQGHRYDIFEDIGCFPTTVNTPVAYPLSFLWPNIISMISAGYCILTLRAFMRRRAEFNKLLSSTTSLTMNRYFRLMSLATMELLFTVPISTYGLYLNVTSKPIYPWISWSDIHSDWFTISTFPALLWQSDRITVVNLELNRWSMVFCALLFFAFFGFADEARKNYLQGYRAVAALFGFTNLASDSKVLSSLKSPTKGISRPTFVIPSVRLTSTRPSSFKLATQTPSYSQTTPNPDEALIYHESKIEVYPDAALLPPTPTSSSCDTAALSSTSPRHTHIS